VILSDVVMFHVENEIKEALFRWMVCLIQLVPHMVLCKTKKKLDLKSLTITLKANPLNPKNQNPNEQFANK
jgi:hypothetical protein